MIHYTVKDGLPSSTAYSTTQDNQGFIWIGTDAGLVRYDGTFFKVFTTSDGLPDNEVLGLHFDAKTDRMWIITYCKQVCYYKNGMFFTVKNDSSLRQITCDFGEFIKGNAQDNGDGVFLYNGYNMFKCTDNKIDKVKLQRTDIGQVKQWSDTDIDILYSSYLSKIKSGKEQRYIGSALDSTSQNGKWIGNELFIYRQGKIDKYVRANDGSYALKGNIVIGVKRNFTNVILQGAIYFIGVEGMGVYTIDTSLRNGVQKIWSGRVNEISRDFDDNIWISTNDDGIYVIKNQTVKNYTLQNGLKHDNVTAVFGKKDGTIFLGNSNGELFSLKNNIIKPIALKHSNISEMIRAFTTYDSIVFILANNMIGYFDVNAKNFMEIVHRQGGPKSMLKLQNQQTILFGFSSGLMEFKFRSGSAREIGLNKRMITMAQHPDGRVYCGSLDGLYLYNADKFIHIEGDDPLLQSRITSLCFSHDSILWIGTPSNGVIAYNGKKIVGHITTAKYLSYRGAICRKVVAGKPNEIWVATNSGIDKIHYHMKDSLVIDNITPLNTTDGLLSDDVNDIFVQDSLIYAATSHGLTILNENELISTHPAPVYISAIKINDEDSTIHDGCYELTYRQNNLQIEYIGVSQQSSGYMRYQYRLLGSSDEWQTTSRTSIDLRSVSPGLYTFEVAVLDKFGNRSKLVKRISFHIAPAFYRTVWFWSIVFILVLALGFYIIRSIFKGRQAQYEKEQSYTTKIIDLEQQALKAQMNPHFIFNCLTAIQHFVNKEDVYSANMYLSNFAKLIRKTLDLSGEQYITLDKEVAYLENYVQLEKMRFQDKFKYFITVDEDVDVFSALIPPMLLQPIIENAIRHGLRYKDDNEGILNISFSREGSGVVCKINDNGIGIKRSRELKTNTHVEYQSKGMKLTESRINAINMISPKKIKMEVKDKYDEEGNATGTMVIIHFEQ